jgi:hypothetical protein
MNVFRSGVKLSIAITTHPHRAVWLERMLDQLGRKWEVRVVLDDRGEPPGLAGLEYTFLRAAREIPAGATHHLVLQDDLTPCLDLVYAVGQKIIPLLSDVPIALYNNCNVVPEEGQWILGGCWGQTKLMPTSMWERFLQFNEQAFVPNQGRFSSDARVGLFYRTYYHDVWCTSPSLVEHASVSGESLLGHNGKVTKARCFIGEYASAMAVDWKRGITNPPKARDSFSQLLRSQAGWLAPDFWRARGIDVSRVRPPR